MKINTYAVLENQRRTLALSEAQKISEVARIANQLQKQGLTRTEALRVAENFIRK